MDDRKIALSTNDFKNLSADPFGKSHYFEIYRLREGSVTKVDTRENVLFRQACGLQGRVEHLHGLLGDVETLVGTMFEPEVSAALEEQGYRIISVPERNIEAVLSRLQRIRTAAGSTAN